MNKTTDKPVIRLQKGSVFCDDIQVMAFHGRAVAREIVFEEVDQGAIINPMLTIGIAQAQILIDDLWHAGLRPSEGTGSAGSLKATENHLADMRKIAFNRLKINS